MQAKFINLHILKNSLCEQRLNLAKFNKTKEWNENDVITRPRV